MIPIAARRSRAVLAIDLYYRPASRTTRALVALVSGIVVLLTGLAVAVWLAGRWMVAPLARLSTQVDKVAGGDLTIAVPRSRIGEIANMVGGNVKSMLPGPSVLSLPSVVQGQLSVPGAQVVRQVQLAWRTQPLVVSLWQQAS